MPATFHHTLRRRVAALALAATAALGACSSDESAEPRSEGERIYRQSCASCHGRGGEGGFGRKIDDGLMMQRYPDVEDQIAVIRDGKGSMPSWEGTLTEEQIRQVAEYTRTL